MKSKGLFAPRGRLPASIHLGISLAAAAIILAAWSVASYGHLVAEEFLPTPGAVVQAVLDGIRDGTLPRHTWTSLFEVMTGFALSCALAIPLGIAMGTYKAVEAAAEPVTNFFRYLPISALIPLLILWVGIGIEAKVAVIFLGTFFNQLIMVAAVASSVPADLLNVSYTLGANRRTVLTKILLPASLPGIFDSMRVSMGLGWTYVVIAELVAANAGLGYMVLNAARGLFTDQIFVGIVVLGLLGLLLDQGFRLLKNWLLPWAIAP